MMVSPAPSEVPSDRDSLRPISSIRIRDPLAPPGNSKRGSAAIGGASCGTFFTICELKGFGPSVEGLIKIAKEAGANAND